MSLYYVSIEVRMVVEAKSVVDAQITAAAATARMENNYVEVKGVDVIAATKEDA